MAIIDAIVALLKAIPIVNSWFQKYELEIERKLRAQIDAEHKKNEETGRPSNEFWDERHI